MAFAVSWKPFVKSKPSATMTTATTRALLCILDRHAFEDIGDVLGAINGFLQQCVNVFPLDDIDRVLTILEKIPDCLAGHGIGLIFQVVDPNPVARHILAGLEL